MAIPIAIPIAITVPVTVEGRPRFRVFCFKSRQRAPINPQQNTFRYGNGGDSGFERIIHRPESCTSSETLNPVRLAIARTSVQLAAATQDEESVFVKFNSRADERAFGKRKYLGMRKKFFQACLREKKEAGVFFTNCSFKIHVLLARRRTQQT